MIFNLKWKWMMLITQKWGKPIKVLKCKHRFCLNCLAACFLSGKNEEESQCPACKMNTLKQTLVLYLICQLCCNCLKFNATHVVKCSPSYNHSTKHIQNCSLNIWPSSSFLVTTMDATLHVLKKKMKLNARKSLTEFITLLLSWPNILTLNP